MADNDNSSWIIGVVLAILADVFTNTGTNLQKLAHTRIEDELKAKKKASSKLMTTIYNSPVASSKRHPSLSPRHGVPPVIVACPSPYSGAGTSPTPLNPSGHISPLIISPVEVPNDESVSVRSPSQAGTPPNKKPNYCTSPIWVLGVALLIGGAIGDFLALGFAAQSTVAPLGSLTLVVNMFMARWMHGERITPLGVIATICIVAGSFLTIAFANHSTFQYSVDEIFALYITTRFIVYSVIMVTSITTMWVLVRRWDKDPHIKTTPYYPFYKLFFAALNGTIGGHNVLFAKFTVEIFAMGHFNAFTYGLFYLTLALMIGTVLTQVKWLNEGLRRFDAIFMVPVSTAFWVFFSAFSGIITFAEYRVMTWFEIIYFCIGIMLILIGVLVFTRTKTSARHSQAFETVVKTKGGKSIKQEPNQRSPLNPSAYNDEEAPSLSLPNRDEYSERPPKKQTKNYQTLIPDDKN